MASFTSFTALWKSITKLMFSRPTKPRSTPIRTKPPPPDTFALDGGPNDDHIRASHGTYNFPLETGKFYDVTGTTGLRFRANRAILTSTAPFAFYRQGRR